MFSDPAILTHDLQTWLSHLQNHLPASREGELICKNLMTDGNVSPAFREEVRIFIAANSPITTPGQACVVYNNLAGSLPPFSDARNAGNMIPNAPFSKLARLVSWESFAKFNWSVAGKTRRQSYRKGFGQNLVQHLMQRPKEVTQLRGQIGVNPVFAAPYDSLTKQVDGRVDADANRDQLGLDHSEFAAGKEIVMLWYDACEIPGNCYRPTILDAKWNPAFLPSLPTSAVPQPGLTQHLQTGSPAVLEVIHAPFNANRIDGFEHVGTLSTDPPSGYKGVRLP